MNAKTWSFSAALLATALAGAQNGPTSPGADNAPAGPVRLARVSFAEGNVSWRPDDSSSWSQATPNLPLQQGAQVWVTGRGRAEIQFDDGSNVRLGNDAVVTLQSLYSDAQGEFTELKLNDGTSSLHLKDKYSIYQVDTPFESVKATGPARLRVDVGSEVSVGVRTGSATVTAAGGDTTLRSGDYVALRNAQDSVRVSSLPRDDAWDRFDEERDGYASGGVEHLPPNIAIVAGGLSRYGHWHLEGSYGWVWGPSVSVGWRPYHHGSWVWVNPFGWTWCSSEEWGWAPYHYGTWSHFGWGWGWCPGPYHQYWSPAVVSFSYYNGDYCWTPLCPEEVIYPGAFSCGFFGADWWFNFSIGGCGIFRPGFGGRCEAFAFGRRDFDRHNWGDRFAEARGFGVGNDHFVPRNAAWGASAASEHGFGQGNQFREVRGNANQYFERGQSVTAASHAFSGPVNAMANRASMTPTHTFTTSERPQALNRALYRAPVSSGVERSSEPFGRSIGGGNSRGTSRSGTFNPSSSTGSSVERARASLGYTGRSGQSTGSSSRSAGSSSSYDSRGDRTIRGSTGGSRGIERSSVSGGSSNVEQARQSLRDGVRSSSSGSSSSSTSRGSSSGYSGRYAPGNSGYSGRSSSQSSSSYHYHGDSQSSTSRGSSSSGRSYGSSSGSSYSGGSRGDSSSRSGGGSRGDSGSRGGSGGGSRGDGGGRGGH